MLTPGQKVNANNKIINKIHDIIDNAKLDHMVDYGDTEILAKEIANWIFENFVRVTK